AAATRLLATVCPHAEYFPDFLTPSGSSADPEERIDTVARTPANRLAAELGKLASVRPLASWISDLASGRPAAMMALGTAMRVYWQVAIAPHLAHIGASVEAERRRLLQRFLRAGLDGVLSDLDPAVRWRESTLEVDYPCDQVLELDGRGLTLVPSFFCWRMPVSLADPQLPPVLVYPIRQDRLGFCVDEEPANDDRVDRLLGSTRSCVLQAAAKGASTGELARQAGISPATASHHATVLRNAGLLRSRRQGNVVLHELTPLGAALLDGGTAVPL
ncbi:MAG TPA: helix-turn-helix domain-containing protein, partial [Pseudonocardiaceae bacterium]|nr:helix-turn-helix domain-containing protein [Pseudonocardiaceae bacterium]